MNTTETTPISPLAAEIIDRHKAAQEAVQEAKGRIDGALQASIECAEFVETAKAEWKGSFSRRWRDEVGLDVDVAKKYRTLHASKGRKVDKAQLLLLGVVERPTEQKEQFKRPKDPFGWAKYVAKAREEIDEDEIAKLTPEQKAVARDTVKPLLNQMQKIFYLLNQ